MDLVTLTKRIADFDAQSGSTPLGDLYLMRGGLLKSEKLFAHAAEDFAKACDPTTHCSQRFNALLETATFRCLCGDNAGARGLFAELATMAQPGANPNWVNFYAKYATCLVSVDMQEALRVSAEAVAKFPSEAEIRLVRGFVLQSSGDTAEAMKVSNGRERHRRSWRGASRSGPRATRTSRWRRATGRRRSTGRRAGRGEA